MKINVSNKKCIRHISLQNMKSAKTRNLISIAAITLTTLLFTALFTITMSIVYSYEQSTFRQVGGYSHGTFKYLTKEQVNELKDDSLIKEYGLRKVLGLASGEVFSKSQVEISYSDTNSSKWMFLSAKEGSMPKENTREAATDTRVLSLLGIEPEIGTEFTLSFYVDGVETTETFTLCGYWEYDEAIIASHVLIPESRADEILDKLNTQGLDGMTGFYNMDVMFQNSMNIEENLVKVLEHHGYQAGTNIADDNYIAIGVNWGYINAQLAGQMDLGTSLSLIAILLLIIFTGYLIIYNVFQISVSTDIRFYGLLKTIGTTGKQLKRIIFIQAITLSAIGIPIGLLLGYGVGAVFSPLIMRNLNGLPSKSLSFSPWIFVSAALFSLITVVISCRKPGKMAAKVSAIEAVRYTEGIHNKKTMRKAKSGASIWKMAWANLGRNRKKTSLTIISLSLAIVLLNLTVTFTNGFDLNKYVSNLIATDYIISDSNYFNSGSTLWDIDQQLPEEIIETVTSKQGISNGGRTYGNVISSCELITEEHYRAKHEKYCTPEQLDEIIKELDSHQGLFKIYTQLYGMEQFCLDNLTVLEGDITKLYDSTDYIAAVYHTDDYGNPEYNSNWAKLGDTVTIHYNKKDGSYTAKEYEVAATVTVPHSLSYRYYGKDEFILNAETFKQDTGTSAIMYYTFDMEEDNTNDMEAFLADYTEKIMPQYNYESKMTYASEFETFKNTFLVLGASLSFIIGLIGILNFLNAILTSILARHHEFAVLQSVGMTGKQLNTLLVTEGLIFTLGSLLFSTLLIIVTAPPMSSLLENIVWFFSYKLTLLPLFVVTPFFAILGILIPLITYRYSSRKSIVERLRETE